MRIDLLVHLRRGRHHLKINLTMLAKSLTVAACVLGAGCDLGLGLVRSIVRQPLVAPMAEQHKEQITNTAPPEQSKRLDALRGNPAPFWNTQFEQ